MKWDWVLTYLEEVSPINPVFLERPLTCLYISLEQIGPVIENDLHGGDDDGDGNDEENGEADVQVLSYTGKLLPVQKSKSKTKNKNSK